MTDPAQTSQRALSPENNCGVVKRVHSSSRKHKLPQTGMCPPAGSRSPCRSRGAVKKSCSEVTGIWATTESAQTRRRGGVSDLLTRRAGPELVEHCAGPGDRPFWVQIPPRSLPRYTTQKKCHSFSEPVSSFGKMEIL